MRYNRYDKGDWNAICDACGRKYKASTLRKRWDGFMVCEGDWETRHPQDFIRGVPDYQAPPWTRPEASDIFLPACTPIGSTAIPSWAMPGCAIPGRTTPIFPVSSVPSGTFNTTWNPNNNNLMTDPD